MTATTLRETIRANYARVQERVAAAAARAGRDPADVTTVAITKTFELPVIEAAHAVGLRDLGENRVQEAQAKIATAPAGIRWHLVGHLQRNKARIAAPLFHLIQSVDSLRLARALDRYRHDDQPVLIQVNLTGNPDQHGVHPDELPGLAATIAAETALRLDGLMAIAPIVDEETVLRPVFGRLRELRENLTTTLPEQSWTHLSMGMTSDFEYAVAEGATIIRVGRAIFGERS
ncbi:MAG TPA: YggS family pyridoxal phosphate-dependent enzyme [Chloroflexota bacterium]|nr:YggS family pyridoxal phosphate-dependent enzyme [Chloroflexota bacterium]